MKKTYSDSPSANSLEKYYSICRENDKLWATFARSCDLSPAECAILFALREGLDTQCAICEEYSMAKQTVNSVIKNLIKKNLLVLAAHETDLRTKKISLTKTGEDFVKKNLDAVSAAEQRVWAAMDPEEKEQLIKISRKYNMLFEQELQEFLADEY